MRRPAIRSAFAVAALSAVTAFAQLNPTVKVLSRPQSPVPSECEEGLTPAQPRAVIAETQPPQPAARTAAAPPSNDLKSRLRSVQSAAEQDDYAGFKAALADAHAAVETYPLGGERDAAADALRVYDDLERLWDYALSSPTGSFFDSGTDFVNMMRRYPDYARAIADNTLNIGGQVVYPTRETRRFLAAEAAKRLARIGVRQPTRIAEAPPAVPTPRAAPTPVPKVAPKKSETRAAMPRHMPPAPRQAARKAPPKKETATAKKETPKKPPVKVAEARVKPPASRKAEPAPTPTPTPTPAPTPAPEPAPLPLPAPVVAPQPVPVPPPTTTTAAPPPPPPQPEAATTTTASTTATKPAQQPAGGGGRMNLLFAVILIVVGIGVLIVLFRASD